MNVSVTNGGKEPFTGRFDGQAFEFEPGKPVVITELAASFLFAYGLPDGMRARVLVRNGWQTNGDPKDPQGPEAALKRLRSFVFKAAPDNPGRPKPEAIILATPKLTTGRGRLPDDAQATKAAADAWAAAEGIQSPRAGLPAQPIRLPGSSAPIVQSSPA